MTNEQDQQATDNAVAIQSGRDTTIMQGVTPEQMKEIVQAIHAQMPTYVAIARDIADARVRDLEDRLFERFAEGHGARIDAFGEPDFQYLLMRANHAYARSGDERVRDTLVDLIAERSMQTERSRLALSLNEAIDKSAVLTRNEFAELSLAYLLTRTIKSVADSREFFQYLHRYADPLLDDISTESASYSYLEAQSCASIVTLGTSDLMRIFKNAYIGVLNKGLTEEEFKKNFDNLPDGKKHLLDKYIMPCINDPDKKQFSVLNTKRFYATVAESELTKEELDFQWSKFEATMMSKKELLDYGRLYFPNIDKLFKLWEETLLKNMQLTSVGIAIAHSNVVRIVEFDADLSIWIK